MSDDVQRAIQGKLIEAKQLLTEVGRLADEGDVECVQFLGLTYERAFGWFQNGELVSPSEWNSSECVIGSEAAEGRVPGTQRDWRSSSWCLDG